MASVLFVDDEGSLRRAVRAALGRRGHTVRTAGTIVRAIQCLEQFRFDGVFVDIWLNDGSGFDLVSWMQNHQPRLAKRVVFVTGDIVLTDRLGKRMRALELPVIAKPFEMAELERYVDRWNEVGVAGVVDAHPPGL